MEAAQFDFPFEGNRNLALSEISVDAGVQTRARLDEDTVKEYAEAMRAGVPFPAFVVFAEGAKYRLADGFHRYEAASRAGLGCVQAQVKSGGRLEAIKHALQANVAHGRRRTNADKRRGVEVALKEFAELTDRAIAELCAVGNALVSDARKQVCDSNNSPPRKGRDGKSYPSRKSPPKNGPAECSPTKDDPVVNNEANDLAAASALPSESEPDLLSGENETLPKGGEAVEGMAPAAIGTAGPGTGTVFKLADGSEFSATIPEEGEIVSASKVRQALQATLPDSSDPASFGVRTRRQRITILVADALNCSARAFAPAKVHDMNADLKSATRTLQRVMKWR